MGSIDDQLDGKLSHLTEEVLENPVPERDGHYIPEADEHGYRIKEQPFGTKRRVRVILMGAGASTVNFLKKAEDEMTDLDIQVYEKNRSVAGTWFENRYPGCACDIPSQYTLACKMALAERFSKVSIISSHGRSRFGNISIHILMRYTSRELSSLSSSIPLAHNL